MEKKLLDAIRFLLSQHTEHFHPKVRAEAEQHLSNLAAADQGESHKEQNSEDEQHD